MRKLFLLMLMSALTISANCQTILTNYQAYRLDSLCRSVAFESYSVSRIKEIKEEAPEIESRLAKAKSLYLQYQNSVEASRKEGAIPHQLLWNYEKSKLELESATKSASGLIEEMNKLKSDLKVDPYDPSKYYQHNRLKELDEDEKYYIIYIAEYRTYVGFKYSNGKFIITEVTPK